MLSREELLHELELLPVWQLRNPLPKADGQPDTAVLKDTPEQEAAVAAIQSEVPIEKEQLAMPAIQRSFRLVVSDDSQWAFILPAEPSQEAETLFQNMLKAVSVTVNQDIAEANIKHLDQAPPKVIVVMGEVDAQQLLNSQQSLETLRNEVQHYHNIPLIATYTPSHLVLHSQDKAKAWDDLCLAKLTIANL